MEIFDLVDEYEAGRIVGMIRYAPMEAAPALLRAKKKPEPGDALKYVETDTDDRAIRDEWGIADAVHVDGEELGFGPPPRSEWFEQKPVKSVRRRAR